MSSPSLPGTPRVGSVDGPARDVALPDYAACLAGLITALDLEAPIVGGLSWGATLAIQFQHQHPGVASALVLAGAYAGWGGSLSSKVRDERIAPCLARSKMAPGDFCPTGCQGCSPKPRCPSSSRSFVRLMSDFHPAGFRTMAGAVAEADLRPVLPMIDVPVLLLYGDEDQRAPVDIVGADLTARVPGARLVVISQAGHLCNAEQPEACDGVIRDFAAATG